MTLSKLELFHNLVNLAAVDGKFAEEEITNGAPHWLQEMGCVVGLTAYLPIVIRTGCGTP